MHGSAADVAKPS